MKHNNRWFLVLLTIMSLQLAACAPKSAAAEKISPVKLEEIEGSDFKRVILTEKAAERLDIQTVTVREDLIERKLTVGGQIMTVSEDSALSDNVTAVAGGIKEALLVRIPLSQNELKIVDRSQPVYIQSLDDEEDFDDEIDDLYAEWDEGLQDDDDEDDALYYMVNGAKNGLLPGHGVLVELSLVGGATTQMVVPYAAVLYGVHGETWVYTNPEPLVFVRQPIVIDFIDGDLAVLSEGPEIGTEIVTIGAAELYGAETGVSK